MDPNVLVSAAISSRGAPRELLAAWLSGRFLMVVSYDLLYELESVLLRPYFLGRLVYFDVLAYVAWIRERAEFVPDAPDWGRFSPDPDDDYLVSLALANGADFLVSQDQKHLLTLAPVLTAGDGVKPLRVSHPRVFVEELGRRV